MISTESKVLPNWSLTLKTKYCFYCNQGANILHWGEGSIYVGVLCVDEDIDGGEKEDVSEANIFVSKASKLSAGSKIWPVRPWNFSEFMI